MSYYITGYTKCTFDEAIEKTKQALGNEGFGIITDTDLQEKFKDKLNLDFRKYRILGACNPRLAYNAIGQEDKIGVLLPCNIVVQEHANGTVEITAINPMESMSVVHNNNLLPIAAEVSEKLGKAIKDLFVNNQ